jgi:uncharacterized protein with HEPN domain
LWDMLQAAEAVVEFTREVSLEEFRAKRIVLRAVERELEIIGEAARRLSEAGRAARPEVPWRQIIALRNFLSHVYDAVDEERIWRLTREEVPALIEQLRALVPWELDSSEQGP